MKRNILAVMAIVALGACQQGEKEGSASAVDVTNEIDKVSYSLGVNIANSLKSQGVTNFNTTAIKQGFDDMFADKELAVSLTDAEVALQTYFQGLQEKKGEASRAEGQAFLDKNKSNEGVVELPSGLQYQVMTEGSGPKPQLTDVVQCHYHGTLVDGSVFDSSVERGQPASFPVNGVIPGWTEALQLMPVGSKWKLFVPGHLAYGERGAGPKIGPNATLVFEVELLGIEDQAGE